MATNFSIHHKREHMACQSQTSISLIFSHKKVVQETSQIGSDIQAIRNWQFSIKDAYILGLSWNQCDSLLEWIAF